MQVNRVPSPGLGDVEQRKYIVTLRAILVVKGDVIY